jgi:hypothetical protein
MTTYKNSLTWKIVSVVTAMATIISLSGVVYLTQVLNVYATTNEVSVEDITGVSPRIAADGESERVALGLNLTRTDTTDVVQLNAVRVRLSSVDTAAEAAVANIETVRIYHDSALSGTNGVFDGNDPLLSEVTRGSAATGRADTTLAAQTQALATAVASTGALTANQTTRFCVAGATPDLAVGDAVAVLDASAAVTSFRVITAVSLNLGVATDGCAVGSDLYTFDTAIASRTTDATADTIQDLTNYPAGITAVVVASTVNLAATDAVKLGTGTVAEIRTGTALTGSVLTLNAGTTYVHAGGERVQETAALGANNAFAAFGAGESVVAVGIPGNTAIANDLGWDIPRNNTDALAGNDLFVVLVTRNGAVNQTVRAQVFTSGDVQYLNNTGTPAVVNPAISSALGTTSGQTKSITFGPDGVAPTITRVETFDNTADGIVDRVVVHFSESMARGVTDTSNFTNALVGGAEHRIEAGAVDIVLATTGTWSTTSVLNDTFTIDFVGTGYTNAAQSTGDSWTVIYNRDLDTVQRFRDATGELLANASVTTTDEARPFVMSAVVKDANANGRVDTLEVVFSETMSNASTVAGLTLRETVIGTTPHTYTLGAIRNFMQSTGTDSNAADTMVIPLTERGEGDVTGTFTLDVSSPGAVDPAGNLASNRIGLSVTVDVTPLVTRAEVLDANGNGRVDQVRLTFSRNVDTSAGFFGDFTVSGYTVTGSTGSVTNTPTLTLTLTEVTFDTGNVPDVTYTMATVGRVCLVGGGGDSDCAGAGETRVASFGSVAVVEEDRAAPFLRSAILYDTNKDTRWSSGETLQLFYSENLDVTSVSTSWANDVFVDWTFSAGGGVTPDSGTVSVSGKIVTFTAGVSAGSAMTGSINARENEIKDPAGNSAATGVLAITVNPTTPPAVDRIETRDLNGNGRVDAILVSFNGLINAATLVAGDWAAIRADSHSTTVESAPDMVVTSVTTESGGNDNRILVHVKEAASEHTGKLPRVKYVQGSLRDLGGNAVASFNQGADTTRFATSITGAHLTVDGASPAVVLKRLADRDKNNKYDQLIVVFSEAMTTTVTASTGWVVAGHAISATGVWSSNNANVFDAYTFADLNNVYRVDIVENGVPTVVPGVSYDGAGGFRDAAVAPLALRNVLAGGEESEVAVVNVSGLVDGDLMRVSGDPDVWIVKRVGTKMFKRLILNPEIFNSYGHLKWENVKEVSKAQADQFVTSDLIRQDGTEKVFRVSSAPGADTGQKRWLNMTPAVFEGCLFDWDAIYIVNEKEAADTFYPTGTVITGC